MQLGEMLHLELAVGLQQPVVPLHGALLHLRVGVQAAGVSPSDWLRERRRALPRSSGLFTILKVYLHNE